MMQKTLSIETSSKTLSIKTERGILNIAYISNNLLEIEVENNGNYNKIWLSEDAIQKLDQFLKRLKDK